MRKHGTLHLDSCQDSDSGHSLHSRCCSLLFRFSHFGPGDDDEYDAEWAAKSARKLHGALVLPLAEQIEG